MFAVFKTGGKQYKVEVGDILSVERLTGEVGKIVSFPEVLMISESKNSKIGTPFVKGAAVTAKVIKHTRAEKILVFKKRRRHNSRRLNGHKQHITLLKIEEINTQNKNTKSKNNTENKKQKETGVKAVKTTEETKTKNLKDNISSKNTKSINNKETKGTKKKDIKDNKK
tara:strand:+ start:439 stop:945 length:507 start_codon:yes stop_codon:yes gene_type:complete